MRMTDINHLVGRRGLMLVLSSPSGAGKTSIARRLLEEDQNLQMSVSATTRKRRPGEVEGRDYTFVDRDSFHIMINNRDFLEYAKVFDHYYGLFLCIVMQDTLLLICKCNVEQTKALYSRQRARSAVAWTVCCAWIRC